MNNIMLDLETMGNGPNAAIIAIGAARFDDDKITDEFYRVVNLTSSINAGMTVDAETVIWWMQQNEQARAQFKKPGSTLPDALEHFSQWIGADAKVWGNGAAFDNVILGNAYKQCDMLQPWKFWNDRCYRTIKSMNPHIPLKRTGTYHNALDDAKSQAEHLVRILKSTKLPTTGHPLSVRSV